jgi:hypothetical protein
MATEGEKSCRMIAAIYFRLATKMSRRSIVSSLVGFVLSMQPLAMHAQMVDASQQIANLLAAFGSVPVTNVVEVAAQRPDFRFFPESFSLLCSFRRPRPPTYCSRRQISELWRRASFRSGR